MYGYVRNYAKWIRMYRSIFQSYITSKSKKDIFLFFEGKDDFKYYVGRISPYINEKEYGVFHCNCKKNVLKIQEMIAKQASIQDDKKNLYFIDRDFDDNDHIPNCVYVTSSYSIENYYFTDSAIKKILIGVIGLSEENQADKLDFKKVFLRNTNICDTNQCQYNLWDNWLVHKTV